MRKSILQGTKADVIKHRMAKIEKSDLIGIPLVDMKLSKWMEDTAKYLGVPTTVTKKRIATGNHPGVFKYDE